MAKDLRLVTTQWRIRQIDLTKGANPQEWEQVSFDKIELIRWLECPHYRECMNYAAGLYWQGWMCLDCKIWKGGLK